MTDFQKTLLVIVVGCIVGLSIGSAFIMRDVEALLVDVDASAKNSATLTGQLADPKAGVMAQVKLSREGLLSTASGLTTIVDKRSAQAVDVVDRRTADAMLRVDSAIAETDKVRENANGRISQAIDGLSKVGDVVKPSVDTLGKLLGDADATVAEAHQFIDDNYDDLSATVANATVATAAAGRAGDEVAKAMPAMVGNAKAMSGDFQRFVDDATKPKKPWQQAIGPAYTVLRFILLIVAGM